MLGKSALYGRISSIMVLWERKAKKGYRIEGMSVCIYIYICVCVFLTNITIMVRGVRIMIRGVHMG